MENKQILYQNPLTGKCPYQAYCCSVASFREHWHGEMEIIYVLPDSSPVTIFADERYHVLSARNAYLVQSTTVHALTEASPDSNVLILEMGYPLLGEDFNVFARHRFQTPHIRFGDPDTAHMSTLEALFLALSQEPVARNNERAEENSREYILSRMRVSSLLFRIAAFLAETMPMTDLGAEQLRVMQAIQAVQSVLSHVRENYPRPISVEYAAAMTGYEKSRFCQLFKQAVGVSFHRYLTDCRTSAALSLLKETSIPVSAVGEAVGIPQPKTFSRLMKERYGASPRELRHRKKEDQDSL